MTTNRREIAEAIGRSKKAIESRARNLGLAFHPVATTSWTPDQDAALRDGAAEGRRLSDIADDLGMSVPKAWERADRLGLTPWRQWTRRTHTASGYEIHSTTGKGAVLTHRVVAADALGRPLKPGEVVHHINLDHTDNRAENLHVFPGRSEHRLAHYSAEAVVGQLLAAGGAEFDTDAGAYRLASHVAEWIGTPTPSPSPQESA